MPQQDALKETSRGTEGTSERTVSKRLHFNSPSLIVKSFQRENAKLQGFNLLQRKD